LTFTGAAATHQRTRGAARPGAERRLRSAAGSVEPPVAIVLASTAQVLFTWCPELIAILLLPSLRRS
jgi:hypothetical protein